MEVRAILTEEKIFPTLIEIRNTIFNFKLFAGILLCSRFVSC